MSDIAAHLVDHALPDVPMRQWVLTVPMPVRFLVLQKRELEGKVLGLFKRVVLGYLRGEARRLGILECESGLIAFEQKFGDGGRLHGDRTARRPFVSRRTDSGR